MELRSLWLWIYDLGQAEDIASKAQLGLQGSLGALFPANFP